MICLPDITSSLIWSHSNTGPEELVWQVLHRCLDQQ